MSFGSAVTGAQWNEKAAHKSGRSGAEEKTKTSRFGELSSKRLFYLL